MIWNINLHQARHFARASKRHWPIAEFSRLYRLTQNRLSGVQWNKRLKVNQTIWGTQWRATLMQFAFARSANSLAPRRRTFARWWKVGLHSLPSLDSSKIYVIRHRKPILFPIFLTTYTTKGIPISYSIIASKVEALQGLVSAHISGNILKQPASAGCR